MNYCDFEWYDDGHVHVCDLDEDHEGLHRCLCGAEIDRGSQ